MSQGKRRRGSRKVRVPRPHHPDSAASARLREIRAYEGTVDEIVRTLPLGAPAHVRAIAMWGPRLTRPQFIYFIQATIGGPVKIGYTTDLQGRLRDLQCGSPFRLTYRAVVLGERQDEAWLHRRWHPARTHGEWFDGGLTDVLIDLARGVTEEQDALWRQGLGMQAIRPVLRRAFSDCNDPYRHP